MKTEIQWKWAAPGIGLAAVSFYALGYIIDRSDTGVLLSAFGAAFIAWLILVFKSKISGLRHVIFLSLIFRLIFLFSMPPLSDDYFRFAWDGRLVKEGISPYAQVPSEVPEEIVKRIDPNRDLIKEMNSSEYYSVYTPLNQVLFFAAVEYTDSLTWSVTFWRVLLILADLLLIALLHRLLAQTNRFPGVSLYAFNPLIILEIAGNIHFEGLMTFALVASIWWLARKPILMSAMALGLSAGLKLVPFLYLPAILRQLSPRRAVKYAGLVVLAFLATGWWMIDIGQIPHFLQSIRLYFQTFEFNASIYYLFRAAGIHWLGYNPIAILGVILPIIGTLIILWVSLQTRALNSIQLTRKLVLAGTVYFLFATTVHPWYLIPLLALAGPARLVYPWVWSALVLFSYSAYASPGFIENPWLLTIEYIVLFALIFAEILHPKWFKRITSLPVGDRP